MLAQVVESGKGFVDPSDIVSRVFEEAVGIVVNINRRGVCIPGGACWVCLTVYHPVVHAVVIQHQWPSFVRGLVVGHSCLGPIQIGVSEVDSGICHRYYHSIPGVAPFPCVVCTVYLPGPNGLRRQSGWFLEGDCVIGLRGPLGINYGYYTRNSRDLVHQFGVYPESPVVYNSINGL